MFSARLNALTISKFEPRIALVRYERQLYSHKVEVLPFRKIAKLDVLANLTNAMVSQQLKHQRLQLQRQHPQKKPYYYYQQGLHLMCLWSLTLKVNLLWLFYE